MRKLVLQKHYKRDNRNAEQTETSGIALLFVNQILFASDPSWLFRGLSKNLVSLCGLFGTEYQKVLIFAW